MNNFNNNLVSLLHQRSIQDRDCIAYFFLKDGITIGTSLTYGELDRKASAIAEAIQSQASPGARALLLYSSSEEFLAAFFGCLYAGVIAVPCPSLEGIGLKQILSRINAIANDSSPSFLLTTFSCYSGLEKMDGKITKLQTLKRIETDRVSQKLAGTWKQPTLNSTDLAYLQYTSGSTSQPKGVCISHNNLMHNLSSMHQALGYTTNSIACTWVPYSHDLGLVKGLLEPLYAGIPCYVMSPVSFMKRPLHWLQAISSYQVTHSDAPNFAYDYCVSQTTIQQRAKLNLSSWLQAGIGAESIRQDTVKRFTETFSICGFKHNAFCFTYGLAEATLCCTATRKTEIADFYTVDSKELAQHRIVASSRREGQTLAECGQPIGDTKIVIVNSESLRQVSDHEVGEIWVASNSVAQGYWNKPEATQQTFQAYIATGEGPFLRTGDLGFFQDGQLFVTGRVKDLIIIRGQNYYPQDIELTVENSHIKLRANCSAVFSVDIEGIEQLVVTAEVDAYSAKNINTDEIVTAIRSAIAQNYELSIYAIVLLKRGTIPKTSSGKIQRHACRSGFLSESLSIISVSFQNKHTYHQAKKLETILIQHPNIEKVVVVARQDKQQKNIFVAYIVPTQEQVPTLDNLHNYLQQKLPSQINSTTFVPIESFPLTSNGKVDYAAFPIPHRIKQISAPNYFAPRNPIEEKLAAIWQEILWIEHPVSVNDNFFELGGNSLLAASLISKVEQKFDLIIESKNFPQLTTIANLSLLITQQIEPNSCSTKKEDGIRETLSKKTNPQFHHKLFTYVAGWQGQRKSSNSLIVGLNTTGTKQNIFWCLQGFRELSQLAKYLGEEQPIYGMRSGHLILDLNIDNSDTIKALAADYVSEILSIQPESPYLLGGNCQGTWIIFEVAQQLKAKGKKITLLCLMEQFIPQTYSGRVALFFGQGSHFNPYKKFKLPELGYRKFYTGELSVNIFSGEHAKFFDEPHIQVLTDKLNIEITKAQSKPVSEQINQEQYQLLSSEAYKAELSIQTELKSLEVFVGEPLIIAVRVKNISNSVWKSTDYSGIRLGNHWLDSAGKVVCWFDGIANFYEDLLPGSAVNLRLKVTPPQKPGFYQLELDLIEEGLTWFKDKGLETIRVEVNVQSLNNKSSIEFTLENENPKFYAINGHRIYERGDIESAVAHYQRAIQLNPNQPVTVYQNLGNSLSQQAQWTKAIIAYEKALKLAPKDANLYFLLANTQAQQGDLAAAAINYQKAIDLEPEYSWFYRELGLTLNKLERLEESIKIHTQAIKLDSDNPDFYCQLGSAQIRMGNIETGVDNYKKAISLNPNKTRTYQNRQSSDYKFLGDYYCQKGDLQAAIAVYQQAIELVPEKTSAYNALGNIQFKAGNYQDAIALYEKAIELDSKQPFAIYKKLGDALVQEGKIEDAIAIYQKTIELFPEKALAYSSLGNLQLISGNYQDAISSYEKAIQLDPKQPFRVYKNLGDALFQEGEIDKAISVYEQALILKPNNKIVMKILNKIKSHSPNNQ